MYARPYSAPPPPPPGSPCRICREQPGTVPAHGDAFTKVCAECADEYLSIPLEESHGSE